MSLETGYAMVIVNQDKKIKEQADEIERLREAYRKSQHENILYRDALGQIERGDYISFEKYRNIARSALQQKESE